MRGLGSPGDEPPTVDEYRSVAEAGEVLDEDATLVATQIVGDRLWLTTESESTGEFVWMNGESETLEEWR